MYPRNERRYVRRLGDHCQTRKIGLNASCHSKPAPSARYQALEVYSIDGLFWMFCIRFGGCSLASKAKTRRVSTVLIVISVIYFCRNHQRMQLCLWGEGPLVSTAYGPS